jgi:hypothetical protein
MVIHYNDKRQKDGITCDLCGKTFVRNFIYYPVAIMRVVVDENTAREDHHISEVDKQHMNLDFCESCFNDIKARVLTTINRREKRQKKGDVWTAGSKGHHHKQSMKS